MSVLYFICIIFYISVSRRKIHPTVPKFPLEISEKGVTELLKNLNCKRSHALLQFVEKCVNAYVRYQCQALASFSH